MKKTRIRVACSVGSSMDERIVSPINTVGKSQSGRVYLLVKGCDVSIETHLDSNGLPVVLGLYIAVDVLDENDRQILCSSPHPYTGEDRIFRVWK